MMRLLLTFLFCHLMLTVYGQSDSDADISAYQQVVASDVHDSLKIKALKKWNELTYLSDPQLDLALNLQIDSICDLNLMQESSPKEKLFFQSAKASATNIIGVNFYYTSQYEKALTYYNRSFEMSQELGDLSSQANALNNAGVVSFRLSNYDEALDYYEQALTLRLEAKDTVGIAGSYRNLATVYQNKGDIFTAIELLQKEKSLNLLVKDSVSFATSLLEMGSMHFNLEQYSQSKSYFSEAKSILEGLNASINLPRVYNSLGACFEKEQQYDSALFYYDKSIAISKSLNNTFHSTLAMQNKAIIYFIQGDYKKAEELVKEAIKISYAGRHIETYLTCLSTLGEFKNEQGDYKAASQLGEEILQALDTIVVDMDSYMDTYRMLYTAAKNLNQHEKALNFHEKYIMYRDSLVNSDNHRLMLQHEFQVLSQADSIKNAEFLKVKDAELKAEKSENNRRKQQTYYLIGGLALILIFGLVMLNRYRLTRRQNRLIAKQKEQAEHQKELIQEAHEEIKDSIVYAKRIQTAILPPDKIVKAYLPDSFVFYQPKDVVAGDFYWMEKVGNQILFAAADCTGHGVPGAMVSVVCNGALNRSVREFALTDPGQILDKAREIVVQEFEKSEEDVKDGMDIALCALDGLKLKYAGANNPLWILRGNEIIEIKADKQPIGKYAYSQPFQTHEIDLQKGDIIYVFSDGYVDQFGGEKGKKFKAKSLRDLLLDIKDLSLSEQAQRLESNLTAWRGDIELVDDICILGVRVK